VIEHLPCAEAPGPIPPIEKVGVFGSARYREIGIIGLAGLLREFEGDRPPCLSPPNRRALDGVGVRRDARCPQAQRAIDYQIEKRKLADPIVEP
jgi:hypothetical protein